jgi:isopenicillin N synthase-like dioxygenase
LKDTYGTKLHLIEHFKSTMSEAADIAVVSFDKFINGGDAEKRAVAKQLYDAFSTVGWVYLKDHGIPQERVDEIFRLVSGLL